MSDEKKDENIEWKDDNLEFIGKKLKAKSADGSEKKWKIFRLEFDTGGQYPFTLDCFDSLGSKEKYDGLKLSDLEEGEKYYVRWKVEKEAFESHGKKHDNRTVFYIGTVRDIKQQEQRQLLQQSQKLPTTEEDLARFAKAYDQTVKPETNNTPNRFVLSWFFNKHHDEFELVKAYAKKHIDKEQVEVPEE